MQIISHMSFEERHGGATDNLYLVDDTKAKDNKHEQVLYPPEDQTDDKKHNILSSEGWLGETTNKTPNYFLWRPKLRPLVKYIIRHIR
jgi:hypothetical protein